MFNISAEIGLTDGASSLGYLPGGGGGGAGGLGQTDVLVVSSSSVLSLSDTRTEILNTLGQFSEGNKYVI